MKLDIKKTIDGLEDINKRFGFEYSAICDAKKVLRMWMRVRAAARNYDIGQAVKLTVHRILEDIEEEFFPSKITAGYKFKIEGTSMEEIRQIVNEMAEIKGVKEVRMHDKD